MKKALIAHLTVAVAWMVASGRWTPGGFGTGVAVGFAVVALADRWAFRGNYGRRGLAFGWFLLIFLREFLGANLQLVRTVLCRRRADLYPNFLTYDTAGLTSFEVLVLSHCISLTPGSTTVRFGEDGRVLLLHALDAQDPDAVRRGIDAGIRRPLLRWTR